MKKISILPVFLLAVACSTEPLEPEPEYGDAYIKACWAKDTNRNSQGDCRGDGHWGKERAPTRNATAIPLPGVPVRLCYFAAFNQCHARESGHFLTGATDSEGYAVFPDREIAFRDDGGPDMDANLYLFLPDTGSTKVRFDGCTLVPIDKYGGSLLVSPRPPPAEEWGVNAHIGELWFITESCN